MGSSHWPVNKKSNPIFPAVCLVAPPCVFMRDCLPDAATMRRSPNHRPVFKYRSWGWFFFFPVLILHNQIMQRYEVSHTSHLLIQSCRGSRSETTQILCQKNRYTERLWRQKWLKCLSEGAEWCPDWGTGDPNAGCSEWGIVGVGSWQEAVGVCWESLAVKAISSPAFWCRKSHFLYDRCQP